MSFVLLAWGCTEAEWNRLNASGGTSARGGKAQATPAQPATRSNSQTASTTQEPGPAAVEDVQAQSVQNQIAQYSETFGANRPGYDVSYPMDDFHAKIDRQSDPGRKDRIRQSAQAAYERPAVEEPVIVAPVLTNAEQSPTIEMAAQRDPSTPVNLEPDRESRDVATVSTIEIPARTSQEASVPPVRKPSDRGDANRVAYADQPIPPISPNRGAAPAVGTAGSNEDVDVAPSIQDVEDDSKTPVLSNVSISTGPSAPVERTTANPSAETEQHVASTSPERVEVNGIEDRIAVLRDEVAKDPNNLDAQYRLRMLYLVNDQDDQALAPTPGMDAELLDVLTAHFKTLIDARSSTGRDPTIWFNRQTESIEQLGELVRSRADIRVSRVALCRSVAGFGRYEAFDEPYQFPSGRDSQVILYVAVDNYRSERTAEGKYRTLLSMRLSLMTKDGKLIWPHDDPNIEDLAIDRRRDFFLATKVMVPRQLEPGDYVLKVEVEDELAGKLNSSTLNFKLVAR